MAVFGSVLKIILKRPVRKRDNQKVLLQVVCPGFLVQRKVSGDVCRQFADMTWKGLKEGLGSISDNYLPFHRPSSF